ncbi:thiamine diphosphokinase [Marinilactibacillus sp. 15R]|uniref:thiamine diphosphokinase n=1 Tax=Marinilactibacillus sp. 15R TaxID=1911586 RepID=UPI000909EA9A|nr:thiamine diphosphokinase [Marinilactibacillus sp. 15R]API89266.1 thiamine diphosphokinase [Marinilactibacillus sp. 15R]
MNSLHIMLGSPDSRQHTMPPLKEQDYYIGVDKGALLLAENGYYIDLSLGDFDSITDAEKLIIEKNSKKVISFEPEKDDTDAELSLVYAMQFFDTEQIILYGWSGGRLDHLMSILMIVMQPRFKSIVTRLIFINQTNTLKFYLPGSYLLFKEPDKKYCSFIGMTPLSNLTLDKGFKYTLDNKNFDYPIALISNEFVMEEGRFSFDSGLAAFIQSKD